MPRSSLPANLLAEPGAPYGLDERDLYARRVAREAEDWLALARERSRMSDGTLVSKALSSLAFSLQHRTHSLAVPSKLTGTAEHQRRLWKLVRARSPYGTALTLVEEDCRLLVSLGEHPLGVIQTKHLSWLRPLVPFGAGLYLLRVTGYEREGYRLSVNVVIGNVGCALTALRHALGHASGDGAAGSAPLAA